jgi:hypothetical protein
MLNFIKRCAPNFSSNVEATVFGKPTRSFASLLSHALSQQKESQCATMTDGGDIDVNGATYARTQTESDADEASGGFGSLLWGYCSGTAVRDRVRHGVDHDGSDPAPSLSCGQPGRFHPSGRLGQEYVVVVSCCLTTGHLRSDTIHMTTGVAWSQAAGNQ